MKWRPIQERSSWRARAMPHGGQLDGYFYVLTGRAGTSTVFSDVWRSKDGVSWECVNAKAPWGKRCYCDVEIVDDVIVLTGGQSLRTFYNDVWHSTDGGKTWGLACAVAPWQPRAGHHTHVLGGELLLFGGARNSVDRQFYPELWASGDLGVTWELRAQLPEDMGRAGMQVVSVNDTLYFMGGDHDRPVFKASWDGRRNDVWRSSDHGRTWEHVGNAPWAARTGHQAIVHEGVVYVVGGHVRGPRNQNWRQFLASDVWAWDPVDSNESMDGWQLVTNSAWNAGQPGGLAGKSDFMLEVRDNQLWTFGGDREVLSPWPQDRDVWVGALE